MGELYLSLGFIDFNPYIEFRFEGENSIEYEVTTESGACCIDFDIDRGKHRRKMSIKPDVIAVDENETEIGDRSKVVISANQKRDSLRIEVDEKDISF